MENEYKEFLLYGVTGSGKTEVYLQLIGKALEQNKELKDANDQSKSELKKSKCLNVFMAIIAFLTLVATVVFGFVTLLMK